jgi:hypothetical protein
VSGTVTYQGRPLKEGNIRFVPDSGTNAPVSVTAIIDGRYEMGALGGVAVGKYKIEVMAYGPNKRRSPSHSTAPSPPVAPTDLYPPTDSVAPTNSAPPTAASTESSAPIVQFIPAKYNTQTTLEIAIPSGSGKITKNFELTD